MKRIRTGVLVAGATCLAVSVLAVTARDAVTSTGAAGQTRAVVVNVEQRPIGTGGASRKTVVNLRDLVAADLSSQPRNVDTSPVATVATAPTQVSAASTVTPTVDAKFDGLKQIDIKSPPDPNAAASPTQIVEVVNTRLQVFSRTGAPAAACPAAISLDTFFAKLPNERLHDPRVIYDNVNNRFTVMMSVESNPPADPTNFAVLRMAHTATSDACGSWIKYSLQSLGSVIPANSFLDQPAIGQDHDAFLFAGANFTTPDGGNNTTFLSNVAFSYPKICAYDANCATSFPIFKSTHYATPASNGGNPMIATPHSYFVASVPNLGYELYQMDNSADTSNTRFTFEGILINGQGIVPPPRGANQPGIADPLGSIDVGGFPNQDLMVRIMSTPTFDGASIWFAHLSTIGSDHHPTVRYGVINTLTNTVRTAIAYHNGSSDDFNPSIAVGMNGASRTVFLNWVYTDSDGGVPATDAVAAITINSTDPPPPINGQDIKLTQGGITNDIRFGDYSSTMIDPVNVNQVCAVTAQQYVDSNGKWATFISRFGAPGC